MTGLRGFARDPELARAAGRKGGKGTRSKDRGFSKDPKLAREAGRKGGLALCAEKRSWSIDPEAAAEASRKGHLNRARKEALLAGDRQDQLKIILRDIYAGLYQEAAEEVKQGSAATLEEKLTVADDMVAAICARMAKELRAQKQLP